MSEAASSKLDGEGAVQPTKFHLKVENEIEKSAKIEQERKKRMGQIKKDDEAKAKHLEQIKKKMRKEQLEKSKTALANNPLTEDQAELYENAIKRTSDHVLRHTIVSDEAKQETIKRSPPKDTKKTTIKSHVDSPQKVTIPKKKPAAPESQPPQVPEHPAPAPTPESPAQPPSVAPAPVADPTPASVAAPAPVQQAEQKAAASTQSEPQNESKEKAAKPEDNTAKAAK